MTAATSRLARLSEARLYLVATLTVPASGSATDAAALSTTLHRIADAAAAGARLVQLRIKRTPTPALRAVLARLRPLLPAEALLLINDDLEAVFLPDGSPLADGVHLGREDAAALAPAAETHGASVARIAQGLAQARRRLGPELLLGTSARTLDEVAAARAAGANYVGFGAMADSTSKSDTMRADPSELRRCVSAFPDFPIFPIGGLHPGNLVLVREAGGRRAALGSAILQASDPASVVRECLRRLAD